MGSSLLVTLILSLGAVANAQVNTLGCNSNCINYLAALENERNIVNSNVWD